MDNLTNVLVAASGIDPQARQQAEQALVEWENQNFANLALGLAVEVATEGKPARELAGLHFKNLLNAKDEQIQVTKHNRWKGVDPNIRNQIKEALLGAFTSPETRVAHTAAVAASEVAAVELPFNEWPQFLQTLLENVTSNKPDSVKICSLECLGFTCERISILMEQPSQNIPEIADTTTDSMLTAIVNGIQRTNPDPIRLVAAEALKNSLVFSQKNMEKKEERDTIMQTICEATTSQDSRVRTVAYDCLASVATLYYEKLQDYMTTLFNLSTETIRKDEEPVAMAAIEFWSSLCEVEQDLMDAQLEAEQRGAPNEGPQCFRYVNAAVQHLPPILTETLAKQDEDVDEDDFNLHKAGQICLSLVSQTVEDAVVPVIMPFVQHNIQNENWRLRDAAIMAFISVLDGPSPATMQQFVAQSIPVLLSSLNDPHIVVRDSAAHCISRICLLHVLSIPSDLFPALLQALTTKCGERSPKVACQACTAIHNLASAFSDDSGEERGTNALSHYMPTLLQTLLTVCDRPDSTEANLRIAAFEAISVLIQNAAPDCQSLLVQLLPAILERMGMTFKQHCISQDETSEKEKLQGELCAVIQVLVQKLDRETILNTADSIMTHLLQVLQARNASCHEDALAAISAVADKLESDFQKYMAALAPFLVMGLRNFQAFHVCIVAVGTVGDICRAIEGAIQPYCDEIMNALVESLKDSTIHRDVKPPVLSCFGDIALAIGGAFEPYLQFSVMLLMQASNTQAPDDDEVLIDYVNQLRESVLEAYTGIVQGLKDGNKLELFVQYVGTIMQFLQQLSMDKNRDHLVLVKAVGLVGDLAQNLGGQVRQQITQPFVESLLNAALQSGDDIAIETANWARSAVQQLVSAI